MQAEVGSAGEAYRTELEEMRKEILRSASQELRCRLRRGTSTRSSVSSSCIRGSDDYEADTDAYLLGERKFEAPKEEDEIEGGRRRIALADGPAVRNETWNKLDPPLP